MFSMVENKPHSVRKRMLSNVYSKSYLQASPHLELISKSVLFDRLLPIIHGSIEENMALDAQELNSAVTMDFVSAYIFGLRSATNFLQDMPSRSRWLGIYHSRKAYEFYSQETPNLTTWTRVLGIPMIPRWCDEANEEMEEWGLKMCDSADRYCASSNPEEEPVVYKQLKQAMSKGVQPKDKDLLSVSNDWKSQRLDIACELYDQVTAGFETSATALTYLYWEMSKQPDLQVELRKELKTLSPSILFPVDTDKWPGLPSSKAIDALPLLNAIIMETLRLHAPIPGIQPRKTPRQPVSLGGFDGIPPNTRVNAQAYTLHQNADVFPEPERFQPIRWLDAADSKRLEEMKRWFWAFGSGGRMCIGSNLAVQGELKTMTAEYEKRKYSHRTKITEIWWLYIPTTSEGVNFANRISPEMKLIVAAIYSNFESTIVNDDGIEAIDAYTVRPSSNKLLLQFKHG